MGVVFGGLFGFSGPINPAFTYYLPEIFSTKPVPPLHSGMMPGYSSLVKGGRQSHPSGVIEIRCIGHEKAAGAAGSSDLEPWDHHGSETRF